MQKIYTIQGDEAYDISMLQAHLNEQLPFQTGMSSKGKQAFIVYFDEEEQAPQVDAIIEAYDFVEAEASRIMKSSLETKLKELKNHLDSLVVGANPQSNSKNDSKKISRMIKLLNKKFDNRASSKELVEIEQGELLDDYLDSVTDCYDNAEQWLKDDIRLLNEVDNYNVQVDPNWPVLEGGM